MLREHIRIDRRRNVSHISNDVADVGPRELRRGAIDDNVFREWERVDGRIQGVGVANQLLFAQWNARGSSKRSVDCLVSQTLVLAQDKLLIVGELESPAGFQRRSL